MSEKAFDGIVFDADGTLLDSMRIWSELGERYLMARGVKAETGLAETLYPMTLEESGEYLKEKYHISDSTEKIIADFLALLEDFYRTEVRPKAGACELLEKMSLDGIRMGIATAGDARLLSMALGRLGADKYFSAIVTCSELGTSKNEADVYLKCAEKIGCEVKRTLVFEDALCGIESAARAGFATVAVCDLSNCEERDLLLSAADLCIEDFSDYRISELLKNGRKVEGI